MNPIVRILNALVLAFVILACIAMIAIGVYLQTLDWPNVIGLVDVAAAVLILFVIWALEREREKGTR